MRDRSPSEAIAPGFGLPVVDLTAEQRRRFDAGAAEFAHRGGSVLQGQAIEGFDAERIPGEATFISFRRPQPLFGLGLVDATPDETFLALARMQAMTDPPTAGRAAIVTNVATRTQTVGRFGWKAQVPSLFQFAGDALLNELGVTSRLFPEENCPSGDCAKLAANPVPAVNDDGTALRAITDFMLMLAPPPRGPITPEVEEGERIFAAIGCASCHTPTLVSGPSEIQALNRKVYHPYSDFLLHDMGSMGDGLEDGAAKGNDFRTAPLWGLRAIDEFLHNGRTFTIENAILAHDGQGKAARDRFAMLDANERAQLLAFLRSL